MATQEYRKLGLEEGPGKGLGETREERFIAVLRCLLHSTFKQQKLDERSEVQPQAATPEEIHRYVQLLFSVIFDD
jgi:hypothetical protein